MTDFASIVEAHQAAVFHFALRMTKDETRAEDALQDTFVAAMKAWPDYRGEASVKTWLFTIARNVVLRQSRRRAGEPVSLEPLDALGLEAGWGDEADPEALFARAEDRAALTRALESLSEEDREVILLRDVEGFSGEEAAALVGVQVRALKSRLHRARLRLAAVLKAEVHDED